MQQQAVTNVNSFIGGLITETSTLNQPPNATTDEDNCVLTHKGERKRRLGIDYEDDYTLNTISLGRSAVDNGWIDMHIWRSVDLDGGRNFGVIHIHSKLYFIDLSSEPVSSNLKSFTVNLDLHLNTNASSASNTPVQVASGRGFLFVVGENINPFYIEYDSTTDTISTNPITLQIRDLDGVEDSLADDDRPSTLSDEHHYNLLNQGWGEQGPVSGDSGDETMLQHWDDRRTDYPSNSDVFWLWRDGQNEVNFDTNNTVTPEYVGNSLAPRGHFLLDPFNKDRATASGISSIATETAEDASPSVVTFFSGRIFYASNQGDIFYSQIIEDVDKAGNCFSVNDPTSEHNPDVLATDGGVIVIPDVGSVKALRPLGQSLIVLASNGVWEISGRDGVFQADDFLIRTISPFGAMSNSSIVNAAGTIFWMNEFGIYTITFDQFSQQPSVTSVTENSIDTFYSEIPTISKFYAKGAYDQDEQRIYWVYRNTAATQAADRFKYDRVLILDLRLNAFYPWSVSSLTSASPYVYGILFSPIFGSRQATETVVDSTGATVVDAVAATVTVQSLELTSLNIGLKLFTMRDNGTNYEWTFAEEKDTDYVDWQTADMTVVDSTGEDVVDASANLVTSTLAAGASYTSYFETGHVVDEVFPLRREYDRVSFFLEEDSNASLFATAYWDFADASVSGKFSEKIQVYDDSTITARSKSRQAGRNTVTTTSRLRGSGRTVKLRFDSEAGKPFNIFGWSVFSQHNRGR